MKGTFESKLQDLSPQLNFQLSPGTLRTVPLPAPPPPPHPLAVGEQNHPGGRVKRPAYHRLLYGHEAPQVHHYCRRRHHQHPPQRFQTQHLGPFFLPHNLKSAVLFFGMS